METHKPVTVLDIICTFNVACYKPVYKINNFSKTATCLYIRKFKVGVTNHWTGLLDWNTGLAYFWFLHILMLFLQHILSC